MAATLLVNASEIFCGKCGVELPPETAGGFCAKCVFTNLLVGEVDATDDPEPTADDAPSRTFEDYEILGELARDSTAVVFKARELSLRRIVALKVLPGGLLADEEALARFQEEATTLAALDHPNIPPVFDLGQIAGHPFLSLRFVDGATLAERFSDFTDQPRRIAELVAKLADAVHLAHERGVLHGGIEPRKILLDAEGEPFLTGFRLALDETDAFDCSLAAVGCVSPEQIAEQALDRRTDVYALGVILAQLLVGRPLFEGPNRVAIMQAVLQREPRLPAPTDEGLAAIAYRCLRKSKDDRYPTAERLAEDLNRWRRGEAIEAPAIPATSALADWRRAHGKTLALVIASGWAAIATLLLLFR